MNRGALIAVLIGGFATVGLIGAALNKTTPSNDPLEGRSAVTDSGEDTADAAPPEPAVKPRSGLTEAPPFLDTAGELREIDGWLNTDATSYEAFAGQVQIVQFWTYSCYNCKNTLPYLQDIYEKHRPDGLEIIGVHAPEFNFERDPANVEVAAAELGVTWPIALDTERLNFRQWQGGPNYWPRTYVVDQNGAIRFDEIGEGRYQELEDTVVWLLENGP
ncbi:MAG: redoxin domain-containing protein [Acidimicrobiales bacterium]|nr:redoxin domain-containing protein [Acidimicrobiales bacterium]